MTAVFVKRSLLFFWAAWLTVVFTTNLLDGAKAAGLLEESWAFASGNYRFVTQTTSRYGTPNWVNGLLFVGVICWEGVAAALFWLAWGRFSGRGRGRWAVYAACTASLALWGAFLLADEVFIAYAVAGTHLRLFVALLATLLAIELLPEQVPRDRP